MAIGPGYRDDYEGGGGVTVFSYNYKIFADSDLLVTRRDAAGVHHTLVLNVDYQVAGAGRPYGGTITLSVALALAEHLTIQRVRPLEQRTDLKNQAAFLPEVHEDTFDHLVMIDQQQQDEISRSVKVPTTSTVNPILPEPEPNSILVWNDAGDAIVNLPVAAGLPSGSQSIAGDVTLSGDLNVGTDAVISGDVNVAGTITGDVKFLQSGFGAIERTVQERLRDTLNVRDFGAVGDGVALDLLPIQRAVAAMALRGGGTVFLPQGTYLLNGTITMTAGVPIRLRGEGPRATVLKRSGTATIVSAVYSHLRPEWYAAIEDLGIDGDNTDGTGIEIISATCFILRDIFIGNCNQTGLRIAAWRDSHIEDIFIESCGDATHPAVVIDALAVVDEGFNANRIFNFHVETNHDTVLMDMVGNALAIVDSNTFYNLKLHGDPSTTNNPARPHLRLNDYALLNAFWGGIIAFGRGTSQVEVKGSNNTFDHMIFGVGPIAQPQCAFDLIGGRNTLRSLQFQSPNYTVTFIRNTGLLNSIVFPKYGGSTPLFTDTAQLDAIYENAAAGTLDIYKGAGVHIPVMDGNCESFGRFNFRGISEFIGVTLFTHSPTGKVEASTYIPTVTGMTNVAGSGSAHAHWIRVGDEVSVSGVLAVTPITATLVELALSLPIASVLGSIQSLEGHCGGGALAAQSGYIYGDAATNLAVLRFIAASTASQNMGFHFTYTVG